MIQHADDTIVVQNFSISVSSTAGVISSTITYLSFVCVACNWSYSYTPFCSLLNKRHIIESKFTILMYSIWKIQNLQNQKVTSTHIKRETNLNWADSNILTPITLKHIGDKHQTNKSQYKTMYYTQQKIKRCQMF